MTKLTTAEAVINEVFVQKDLDPAFIKDADIIATQLQYIKPVLGKDLYNEITTQVDANTLTAANKTLLNDYIKAPLHQYLKAKVLTELTYQPENKGVLQFSGESETNVGKEGLQHVRRKCMENAETLIGLMREYLDDNSANYPLYSGNCNGETNEGINWIYG